MGWKDGGGWQAGEGHVEHPAKPLSSACECADPQPNQEYQEPNEEKQLELGEDVTCYREVMQKRNRRKKWLLGNALGFVI